MVIMMMTEDDEGDDDDDNSQALVRNGWPLKISKLMMVMGKSMMMKSVSTNFDKHVNGFQQ